jgi:hypothetical protein
MFESVEDHTEGGKSDETYGYAKEGFESEANKDGLHPPSKFKTISKASH